MSKNGIRVKIIVWFMLLTFVLLIIYSGSAIVARTMIIDNVSNIKSNSGLYQSINEINSLVSKKTGYISEGLLDKSKLDLNTIKNYDEKIEESYDKIREELSSWGEGNNKDTSISKITQLIAINKDISKIYKKD